MTRAVVIRVRPLLQLTREEATTVTAANETAECEIAANPVLFRFSTPIEQSLNALPGLAAHEGCVRAAVGSPIPVERATVNPLSQNLVKRAFVQ